MNGYNGSQLWDTAFAVQALATAADEAPTLELKATVGRAYGFVEASQVRADVPDREAYFRDPSRGGWPFSTRDHGWPITDCTAEGLKACLALAPHGHVLPEARLREAVELILYWQNDDGGWATYERTRGPRWLEQLNPSDAFGSIMIDYPWVECTSACVQALAAYQKRHDHPALERAITRGARFIQEQQRSDGSWEGNWGVCFTYGTWFGVWGLRAAGLAASHSAIQTAADFLVAHQGDDGGWGESIESCRERRYVATPGQAVMTAWALLALVAAGRGASPAVERGARFLVDRQHEDGTFPPEGVAGVFNRTCGIHYDNYLGIFPLWALAKLRAELR
jgi:squalene/oxidosqualene cyclase-like protein